MSIITGNRVRVPNLTGADSRPTTRDHMQALSPAAERRADILHWAGVAALVLLTAVTVWAAIKFGPGLVEFFWTEQ